MGRVSINRWVDRDIPVQLISSAPGVIAAPSFVIIPAGQKSAEFELTIVDDTTLEGLQSVTITAHVPNWTDGTDSILVKDNDRPQLFVSAPARVSETDGVRECRRGPAGSHGEQQPLGSARLRKPCKIVRARVGNCSCEHDIGSVFIESFG